MEKYKITAKEGDRRIYRPRLEGKGWTEHPMYGKSCTVIQSGAVYDLHLVRFDVNGKTTWANGDELVKEKRCISMVCG